MIIAIDGPAGAGKSTVAKILAKRLGFLYIDTGAMYRALSLKALRENIEIKDTQKIIDLASCTQISLSNNPDGSLKVLLDEEDVTELIRQPAVTQIVSEIAKIEGVRRLMWDLQRKLAKNQNSVLDGRDIGTVVFPNADKKFFLDADFKERVKRRYKELKELKQEITWEAVEEDLRNRDKIDSTRACAPLKKAEDALYVDTTHMSIEEVVEYLLKQIQN